MKGFAALIIFSLAFTVTQAQTWQELARWDCGGTFELLGTVPLGFAIKAPLITNAYNALMSVLQERVQCACPNATTADFNLAFDPITGFLNSLQNTSAVQNSCINSTFPRNLYQFGLLQMSLPTTCDLDSWQTSGTCGLKYSFPKIDVTLQLGLSKCTNSMMPAISVTCAGQGCQNMLQPCNSDSDCGGGGLTCFDVESFVKITDMANLTYYSLAEIGIYNTTMDTAPGCYQAQRGNGAPTPQNDIFTNFWTYIADNFFGLTQTYSALKVCGFLEAANITDPDFNLNDTLFSSSSISFSDVEVSAPSCVASSLNSGDAYKRYQITLPSLTAWNGIDSTGANVFNRQSYIPTASPIAVDNLLLEYTCDQNFIFQTNNAGFVFQKGAADMFYYMVNFFQSLEDCRFNPSPSTNTFLASYGVWSPAFWLRLIDPAASTFPVIQNSWFYGFFPNFKYQVENLPSSCTWNNWVSTGTCQFDFTGLQTLLLADITLRITISTCSSDNLLSSYSVQCIGAGCPLFSGLDPCDDDSQCFSGTTCQSLSSVLTEENVGYHIIDDIFDVDFFDLLMSPIYNKNLCATPSWFNGSIPTTPPDTCSGPSMWQNDMNNFILATVGTSTPNTGVKTPLQYCLIDFDVVNNNTVNTWVNGLVTTKTVNGNVQISLSSAFRSVTPSSAPTPSLSPSVAHTSLGSFNLPQMMVTFVVICITLAVVLV